MGFRGPGRLPKARQNAVLLSIKQNVDSKGQVKVLEFLPTGREKPYYYIILKPGMYMRHQKDQALELKTPL